MWSNHFLMGQDTQQQIGAEIDISISHFRSTMVKAKHQTRNKKQCLLTCAECEGGGDDGQEVDGDVAIGEHLGGNR